MPLPFQQAREIEQAVIGYLRATFGFQDLAVKQAFDHFLITPDRISNPVRGGGSMGTGIFKGPYLSLKLPFVQAGATDIPLEIKPPFPPFAHQQRAFERLTTQGDHAPQPTILTTGTGSGKTESFLFPLLDYCYQQRHRPGIKAIILYPMNALATDQAGRIAEAIWQDPKLKPAGQPPLLTAGLFIGLGAKRPDGQQLPPIMGSDHLIESRQTIVDRPPDILLTNFKMLDYALLRHDFHQLWQHNLKDRALLRFLVLDELHTYDGAQGTDVANLIRRLKLKLRLPARQLCPVGTSATLGSGPDSRRQLADYAQKIFGEPIEVDALIEEHRLSVEEYFPVDLQRDNFPSKAELRESLTQLRETPADYAAQQANLWALRSTSGVALGRELQQLRIVRELVSICQGAPESMAHVRKALGAAVPAFGQLESELLQDAAIGSLLTLLARARTGDPQKPFPFVYVQVQLWLRALGRVQRLLQVEPVFAWEEEADQLEVKSMPPWHCRECGASGWVVLKPETQDRLSPDHTAVYRASLSLDKNLWYIDTRVDAHLRSEDYEPSEEAVWWLDGATLRLYEKEEPGCFPVLAYRRYEGSKSQSICPRCNSRNSLAFIGAGVASLTSVALSQLLASEADQTPLDQRKVLTFTNGVQDAAHRAGFFQARNYRFLLRTALQQLLRQQEETSVALPDLYQRFADYWREQGGSEARYVARFFPADHQGSMDPADYYREGEGFAPGFMDEFDRRMSWEIWSQYTYNALIGRTLEKTGASATFFDPQRLQAAYQALQPWLAANALHQLSEEEFMRFLSGFLHRLRVRGGVDHPYLRVFRSDYPSYYSITQKRNGPFFLMQNFGKRTRLPSFLRLQKGKGNLDTVSIQQPSNRNWFHRYFTKSFALGRADHRLINDFYEQLLPRLAQPDLGLLDRKEADGKANYGLRPEAIWVSLRVQRYACLVCGNQLHSTTEAEGWLDGAACLSFHCSGRYEQVDLFADEAERFYQQVYQRGNVVRVFAAEHTGMLDRQKREAIEASFKGGTDPQSLNVLVATSTLEMGIDIGDLNHAINTGVPPTPANFLQRVGRAGRKSGQAFLLNLAGRGEHDLYFFTEPKEMMAGEVTTPGCFLEAIEILRRHLLAFVVDSWTLASPHEHQIPKTLRRLLSKGMEHSEKAFTAQLVQYLAAEGEVLFDRFRREYVASSPDNQPLEEALDELESEWRHGRFEDLLRRFIPLIRQEYDYHREHHQQLVKRLEKMPATDPERDQLERDRRNVRQALRSFRRRQTLEQLTNSGYLPNYGFPETGVELEARLRRPNAKDERSQPLYLEFNPILRPASQAIRELAPGNRFYGQGYHFPIRGIRVLNWQEEVRRYRFCSRCDHLALDQGLPKQACPKCGDTSWYSQANTHDMVDFKKAIAFEDADKASLDDSSDEREEGYYVMSRHFDLPENGGQGAYVLSRIPFGIEFIRRVDYTEINAGDQSALPYTSHKVKMQDQEVSGRGFIVCKSCGMAQVHTRDAENKELKARDYHFPYCKHRDRPYADTVDEVFGELYLRRQLTTEVLRILLPIEEINSEVRLALFKAGIGLGLKHYFGGNPQHLEMKEYWEIDSRTGRKQHYLMLIDTIPGGTGYLGQVAGWKEFSKVLENAFEAIRDCRCGEQDGCYHCIYSYANQYEREWLSRKEAEALFGRIKDQANEWTYRAEGFSGVESGQIEESELEKWFVRLLEAYSQTDEAAKAGWRVRRRTVDGAVRYEITVPQGKGEAWQYEMIPQYGLGEGYTRPDFWLRPRQVLAGQGAPVEMAIFLDGYEYHAKAGQYRFPADVAKRWRLREAGYATWTLTWDDLQRFETKIAKEAGSEDEASVWFQADQWSTLRGKHPALPDEVAVPWSPHDQVSRLLHWLKQPQEADQQTLRWLVGCHTGRPPGFLSGDDLALAWQQPGRVPVLADRPADPQASYYLLNHLPNDESLPLSAFLSLKADAARISLAIPDGATQGFPTEAWNRFWQLFNLVQWVPGLRIALPDGDALADEIAEIDAHQREWDLVVEEFEEAYHALIQLLLSNGVAFHEEQGFELVNELDETIAEAEVGITGLNIVIDALDDRSAQVFAERGFRVLKQAEFSEDLIQRYSP